MHHSPARRLRDALEPVAAVVFHARPCLDAFDAAGLSTFPTRYSLSRGCVLGDCEPAVMIAAFGVFEPTFLIDGLRAARTTCPLDDIRAIVHDGTAEALRTALAGVDVDRVRWVAERLHRATDDADLAARPLFAGHRAWPRPDDPFAALWRSATLWRELRGDSHLAACATHGVTGLQANILNELDNGYELFAYTATRNWSQAAMRAAADALRERGLLDGDRLSEDGRQLRTRLEQATDLAVRPAITELGDDLDAIATEADGWSQRIIDRGWFPTEAGKRTAG